MDTLAFPAPSPSSDAEALNWRQLDRSACCATRAHCRPANELVVQAVPPQADVPPDSEVDTRHLRIAVDDTERSIAFLKYAINGK